MPEDSEPSAERTGWDERHRTYGCADGAVLTVPDRAIRQDRPERDGFGNQIHPPGWEMPTNTVGYAPGRGEPEL